MTYQMMESAWRRPAIGAWPDWMDDTQIPFAQAIDRATKHVVSSTLNDVDWNAELVPGDLAQSVQRLKEEPGDCLWVGGVILPLALADLGLIDEFEFVIHPVVAGHGPTLFAGLGERLELKLEGRQEFTSGAVALRYRTTRQTAGAVLAGGRSRLDPTRVKRVAASARRCRMIIRADFGSLL